MITLKFRPNLWLTVLSLLLFGLFLALGFWQLQRAKEKQQLLGDLSRRAQTQAISINELSKDPNTWQYQPVSFTGQFWNKTQFLLDNKINQGQVGYEVITPVKIPGIKELVLVNRGWIAAAKNRTVLPKLKTVFGSQTIHGIIRLPLAKGLLLKDEKFQTDDWPIRIQQLNFQLMQQALGQPIYPFVVLLDKQASHGFVRQWQMINMRPAKHIGYAVQWFAFAGLLIIIYFAMCFRRESREKHD